MTMIDRFPYQIAWDTLYYTPCFSTVSRSGICTNRPTSHVKQFYEHDFNGWGPERIISTGIPADLQRSRASPTVAQRALKVRFRLNRLERYQICRINNPMRKNRSVGPWLVDAADKPSSPSLLPQSGPTIRREQELISQSAVRHQQSAAPFGAPYSRYAMTSILLATRTTGQNVNHVCVYQQSRITLQNTTDWVGKPTALA